MATECVHHRPGYGFAVLAMALVCTVGGISHAEAPTTQPATLTEAQKAFRAMLTGATLEGQFTLERRGEAANADAATQPATRPTTQPAAAVPRTDRYIIETVRKLPQGDMWMIVARIQYGSRDVKVPVPIEVKFVDNTPMMVMDRQTIPLLGTFDVRILFHDGHYAGTWSGSDYGGVMWGKVIPADAE